MRPPRIGTNCAVLALLVVGACTAESAPPKPMLVYGVAGNDWGAPVVQAQFIVYDNGKTERISTTGRGLKGAVEKTVVTPLPALPADALVTFRETVSAWHARAVESPPACPRVSDSHHTYFRLSSKYSPAPLSLRCLPPGAWRDLDKIVNLQAGLGPITTDPNYRE